MAETERKQVVYPRLRMVGTKDKLKIVYQEYDERQDLPANELEMLLRWRLTGEM